MPRKKKVQEQPEQATPQEVVQKAAATDPALLQALSQLGLVFADALAKNKPVEKVRIHKPNNVWSKPGVEKPKLKRKLYHHGLWLDPDMLTADQITLANQLKPGRYMDGYVEVRRRRDRGIDIDYSIKTAAQRLKLNNYGVTSFDALMQRIIDESNDPRKYARPEDLD